MEGERRRMTKNLPCAKGRDEKRTSGVAEDQPCGARLSSFLEYEVWTLTNTVDFRTSRSGWGARIRTRISGSKVRCATIAPRPISEARRNRAGCIVSHPPG